MPYTYEYPRPAVSADVVVYDRDSRSILLIERKNDPFAGAWALPGGFMEMDEDASVAAIRELEEETGLKVDHVRQVGAYSAVDRDPRGRVVTIAFFAVATQKDPVNASDDAADTRWFELSQLPELAFDHQLIIDDSVKRYLSDAFDEQS